MTRPSPTILSAVIAEARSLFVRAGDASDLSIFLLGMAAVAGMLLTIGACA